MRGEIPSRTPIGITAGGDREPPHTKKTPGER